MGTRLLIPATKNIARRIFVIRGQKVMLDRDLAELYQVPTKALNQAVRRNSERFPEEFIFRLSQKELQELVTICDRFRTLKHANLPPLAFTDYGVAMLSSVLHSQRAIQVNVAIMRAFVEQRKSSIYRKELAIKLRELQRRLNGHDVQIRDILTSINELAAPRQEPRRKIGFRP